MSSKFEKIVQTANLMPTVPKAVQKILILLNSSQLTITELAEAVSHEPVLSAKVLRLANSAFFGATRKIDSVERAALLVGIDAIRTLVLASGMMESFNDFKSFDLKRFWSISLLSAYVAKDLANLYPCDSNKAYTAALLHGLGVLAIHKALPELAANIEKQCLTAAVFERADVENKLLGFHHAEISAELARMWHLPEEIGESIRDYPHPNATINRLSADDLSHLIHLSVGIAIDLHDKRPTSDWPASLDENVAPMMNIVLNNLDSLQPKFEQSQKFVDMIVTAE